MNLLKKIPLFAIILHISLIVSAQDKYTLLEEKLKTLSVDIPALEEKITISVTNVSLQEFLRGVANNSGLNIDVASDLNYMVVNNFSQVKVKDILLFVCRQFNLNLTVIGNIITIYKEAEAEIIKPQRSTVQYDTLRNLFTIDYSNESLMNVAKEITRLTGNNVILSPGTSDKMVSGYVQNMPFDNAIDKFMFANNLKVTHTEDNFYLVENNVQPIQENFNPDNNRTTGRNNSRPRSGQSQTGDYVLDVTKLGFDSMNVVAVNAPLSEVIKEIAGVSSVNYFITSPIEDKVTFKVDGQSFDKTLKNMLNGRYTYKKSGEIYVIGEQQEQGLRELRVIQLQNRSIDKLIEFIPQSLTKEVEIVEFPDLNSLLVSGNPGTVATLENFIRQIDKIVPVIMIEVIIVDISKRINLTTGINAGLGDKPVQSGGNVFPDIDVGIGADAVNDFLKKNEYFGIKNLGNVAPNFYVTLKALEEHGLVNIRSTPMLSTLNGHEATLTIGNTEYYLELQSNLIGTQNPVESTSQVYKSLNAELAVTIKPIVSGDDQITLTIEVKQSDFTERISPTAPPGTVTRTFQSEIRVKNQEMVLLGGLEEKRITDSSSGLPLLSRIPVLKWIFSSRSRENAKSKLNVFIRPTIIG